MTSKERPQSTDYVQRISIMASERNPLVVYAEPATGSRNLDDRDNRAMRESFLSDRCFLQQLDEFHHAKLHGKKYSFKSKQLEQAFLQRRSQFYTSLLPIGIYLFYQKGELRSKIVRHKEYGDYNAIQESFGDFLVKFSESFVRFKWLKYRRDSREKMTYKFICKLTKTLSSVKRIKITPEEDNETKSNFKNAKVPDFQESSDNKMDLATKINQTLNDRQISILILITEGYSRAEIIKKLKITKSQYKKARVVIRRKLFKHQQTSVPKDKKKDMLKKLYDEKKDKISPQQERVMDEYFQIPENLTDASAFKIIAERTKIKPKTVKAYFGIAKRKLQDKDNKYGNNNLTHKDLLLIRRFFSDEQMHQAISQKLTDEQKEILKAYYENMSCTHQEIVKITGINKNRAYRARKKLEKLIVLYDRKNQHAAKIRSSR